MAAALHTLQPRLRAMNLDLPCERSFDDDLGTNLKAAVLGRDGGWWLRVDLRRVPDVLTVLGEPEDCRKGGNRVRA